VRRAGWWWERSSSGGEGIASGREAIAVEREAVAASGVGEESYGLAWAREEEMSEEFDPSVCVRRI
jgi:hypothetical protein